MSTVQVDIPHDELEAFCERWGVSELSTVDHVDRSPEAGIELQLLADFPENEAPSLFDLAEMEFELEDLTGLSRVEVITRSGVETSRYRTPEDRRRILDSAQPLYQLAE